jgi:hypothetical protein
MGRTEAASRQAGLAIAVCAMVFAPVVFAPVLAWATTSDVPSASGQGSASAIAG